MHGTLYGTFLDFFHNLPMRFRYKFFFYKKLKKYNISNVLFL